MAETPERAVTLTVETCWTLLRALVVAMAAVAIGGRMDRALGGLRGRRRTLGWALMLAPALTPSIFVGETLTRGWFADGARAELGEPIYAVLLLARLAPLAAVVFSLCPPPVTAGAWFCFRQCAPLPLAHRVRFRLSAAGCGPAIAFTLVFLLAFSDAELAAWCGAKNWIVAYFDAHAGGLALRDLLRLGALPLAITACGLAALWLGIRNAATSFRSHVSGDARPLGAPAALYLAAAAGIMTVLPLLDVGCRAAWGFATLLEHAARVGASLTASVAFASVASVAAWKLAQPLASRPAIAATAILPGLLGAPVLTLATSAVFEHLQLAPDSFATVCVVLTVWLLPLAVLLRWILDATRPDRALFVAAQARHRTLLWQLDGRRRFAAWALLFCAALFEFTAGSILAPSGLTPALVRAHSFLHASEPAAFPAMLGAILVTAVAVLLLTGTAARFYARHHGR